MSRLEQIYVFDTSAFVGLQQRRTPMDVFPSVWDMLLELIEDERIISPNHVKYEISQKTDEVSEWLLSSGIDFIDESELSANSYPNVISKMSKGVISLRSGKVVRLRKRDYDNHYWADPWVVSLALDRGAAVVTDEASGGGMLKIPDVCEHFDVECLNVIDVMRREEWVF